MKEMELDEKGGKREWRERKGSGRLEVSNDRKCGGIKEVGKTGREKKNHNEDGRCWNLRLK